MEEMKKDLENMTDAAEETAAEAAETAEETVAEVKETVEETVENAEEAVQEAEAAVEAAEEKVEEAAEKVEEAAEKLEHAAGKTTEKPIIKKKKKLDKTNVIVIVVCAVIVLACLGFVAYKLNWIKFPEKPVEAEMEMADYSRIEVLNSAVEVTDETVDSYLQSLVQSQTKQIQETEGTVAEGDLLTIDFKGNLTATGEEFAGGTAENQSCTVGAGRYIAGFEEGLVGQKSGSTVNVNVVFPEDYDNKDLAGKPAVFEITIKSRTKNETPECNDDFVKDYSYNYLPKQLNTVDELKEYIRDYIYHFYLHEAMMQDLQAKQVVKTYDPEQEANLVNYTKKSLEYNAAMYGYDADIYAQMYGYYSAEYYVLDEAHYYMNLIMLIYQIFKDKELTYTDEEVDQAIVEYMARSGYNDTYTLEEFKEQSGEEWLYLFTNLDFKYDKAMEALEGNVVFVDTLSRDAQTETEPESETVPTPDVSSSGQE